MNNRNYSVIVFDLGNVLLPFDYDIVIKRLENVECGLGHKFKKLYADNYNLHRNHENGSLSSDKFIDTMLGWVENKVTREEFIDIYAKLFEVNTELTKLLPKIKENHTLVLLSNTNPIHMEYGWKDYDFIKQFDKLILSHEVGANKPESEIYEAVEKFTGVNPSEHYFIDDIAEYVEAAKNRGWGGFNLIENQALIKELIEIGII